MIHPVFGNYYCEYNRVRSRAKHIAAIVESWLIVRNKNECLSNKLSHSIDDISWSGNILIFVVHAYSLPFIWLRGKFSFFFLPFFFTWLGLLAIGKWYWLDTRMVVYDNNWLLRCGNKLDCHSHLLWRQFITWHFVVNKILLW